MKTSDQDSTDITETLINTFGYNDLFSNHIINQAVDEIKQLREIIKKYVAKYGEEAVS